MVLLPLNFVKIGSRLNPLLAIPPFLHPLPDMPFMALSGFFIFHAFLFSAFPFMVQFFDP
jgi:hypothetical protein